MAVNDNDKIIIGYLEEIRDHIGIGSNNLPSSRRLSSYNYGSSGGYKMAMESLDAQKKAIEDTRKKQYDEAIKDYENYLKIIEHLKISEEEKEEKRKAAERERDNKERQADYAANLKRDRVQKKQDAVERQKLASDGLAEHLNRMRWQQEEHRIQIAAYQARINNGEKLTSQEKEELAEHEKALEDSKQKELNLLEKIRQADEKNGTANEKWLKLQTAKNDYLREEKKLKEDLAAEQLAIDENEALSLEEKLAAKLASQDNFNQRLKSLQVEYGRDENGNATSKAGILGDAMSEAGENNSIVGAINGAVGGVSDIIQTISMVKDLISTGIAPVALIAKILGAILKGLDKISKSVEEGIEEYENIQVEYLSKVNTRLDTGDLNNSRNFDNIATGFNAIFGSTKYFSQKSLIGKLGDLVDQGVVFNVEQRAILSELSKRMVDTFNMIDDHLLTLTKLQQADMSVAQLGAESLLTEFFNNTFQDNSYMTNMYDSVTSSIMDALSTMNAQDAVAFNYNVNKWLGSLYSLGMSNSGVSTLAEGINAFATGNNDYFSGNDAARVLFASASEGAFADALVNGLNASNIDTLMGNIIDYLSSISADTNNVTKQVKAGIFGGLSYSDIRSVANLTVSDVQSIKNSQATWETTKQHVEDYLLDFAEQNTTLAIQMKNLVDNTKYALGENFVQHPIEYTAYKIGQVAGGWVGTALMKLSELAAGPDIFRTLINSVTTFNDSIDTSLNRASNFSTSSIVNNSILRYLGLAGGLLSDIIGLSNRKSYWNLADEALINSRGQSFLGKPGMSQGLSTSTTIDFSSGISATNGLPLASATSINNDSDTATAATLDQTSKTVQARLHNVEDGNSTVRDINSLYQELFETQAHPIRVQVAELEDGVKTALEALTYQTTDEITHDKIDITNDRIDRLLASGAISAVFL